MGVFELWYDPRGKGRQIQRRAVGLLPAGSHVFVDQQFGSSRRPGRILRHKGAKTHRTMEPSKPVSITLGGSREDMLTRRGRTYVHNKRDGRLELEFQRRRRSGYSCDSGTPSLAGRITGSLPRRLCTWGRFAGTLGPGRFARFEAVAPAVP
jgi:hypothetical protein